MKKKNMDFNQEMERIKYINENLPLAIGNEHVASSLESNIEAPANETDNGGGDG